MNVYLIMNSVLFTAAGIPLSAGMRQSLSSELLMNQTGFPAFNDDNQQVWKS